MIHSPKRVAPVIGRVFRMFGVPVVTPEPADPVAIAEPSQAVSHAYLQALAVTASHFVRAPARDRRKRETTLRALLMGMHYRPHALEVSGGRHQVGRDRLLAVASATWEFIHAAPGMREEREASIRSALSELRPTDLMPAPSTGP